MKKYITPFLLKYLITIAIPFIFISHLKSQNTLNVKDTVYMPQKKKLDTMRTDTNVVYINVDRDAYNEKERIEGFIQRHTKYPKKSKGESVQGNVVDVQFVIGVDGKVRDAVVNISASPSLDAEALRVISSLPKHVPAQKDGRDVSVRLSASVMFPKIERPENIEYTTGNWLPEYRGGLTAMLSYVSNNLKYPYEVAEERLEGHVVINFVVSKTGEVIKPEIIRHMHPSCDAEAVRVVLEMPDWIPGYNEGKPIDTYFTLPINFRMKTNGFKNPASSRTY